MKCAWTLLIAFPLACAAQNAYLDLAPYGKLLAGNAGIQWDEERDIREIRVNYADGAAHGVHVEYWFKNWPYPSPKMPTIEDPVDDPWQGQWVRANVTEECGASNCTYTLRPLTAEENPRASNLPGVTYRRTLKIRLVSDGPLPAISGIQAYSESKQKPLRVRVELGGKSAAAWTGRIEVFNGRLQSTKPYHFGSDDSVDAAGNWHFQANRSPKGLLLDLVASDPAPSGSHDITIVTIHAKASDLDRTFSFSTEDLTPGPIRIPDFDAAVFVDGALSAPVAADRHIRELIPLQPEQTYERATREIPRLDPWEREWGGSVYLPLATDSSWQKFAFDYSGNVFISKQGTKAKSHELSRLHWNGDKLLWKIGTGPEPYYREDHKTSISVLDGYLPVVTERWERDGLHYTEEAFATLLRGPLSPTDSRSEHTPAILMIRLTAENPSGSTQNAHLWVKTDPDETLSTDGRSVKSEANLRAWIDAPSGQRARIDNGAAHITFLVHADGKSSVVVELPFVSDLTADDLNDLQNLNYDEQRNRVIAYWRPIVQAFARISVPEPKFNDLVRSVIPHIHISTTKDPASGLYMVPAASYIYQVFANEAAFQSLLLDTLGDNETSAAYLETLLKLQGSKNFPGIHQGSYDGVFHGARLNADYDYTASGYGLDHGTVLWVLAEHYLYTRDKVWLQHAWPHMSKAIDWIVTQRATTKHMENGQKSPDYGLLPASQLEDNPDWSNWFAINGYAWAGMDRTAKALADAGLPEAGGIRQEADAYRDDLRSAVLRASQYSPVVHMRDGTYEPYVPVLPFRRLRLFGPIRMDYYNRYRMPDSKPLLRLSADRETLYGPMILLNLGLFGANEPLANWVLDDWEDNQTLSSGMGMNIHGMTDDKYWFSQGGMVFQANLQNPIDVYLQRHEIPAAIRTLYNDFAACIYPDVNVFTEEYHQWRHGSGPFYKVPDEARFINRLRDMLVFEQGDTLLLAAGAPRRWLAAKDGIRVDRVMTYFGPVTYTMHAGDAPKTVIATVNLPARNAPKAAWLVARTPGSSIQSVTLNGRPWNKIDRKLEAVELPSGVDPIHLKIQYQ